MPNSPAASTISCRRPASPHRPIPSGMPSSLHSTIEINSGRVRRFWLVGHGRIPPPALSCSSRMFSAKNLAPYPSSKERHLNQQLPPDQFDAQPKGRPAPLICFSHLRWDFVLQRPQHLMERFAGQRQVYFFEEYIPTDHHLAYLEYHPFSGTEVISVRPRVPHWWDEARRETALRGLLDTLLRLHGVAKPVLWFYSPMMFGFAKHVDAAAVVYDCMDELANFRFAPHQLKTLEAELIERADVVFTGGESLFAAKRNKHDNIHAFPSSVDVAHFAQARNGLAPAGDLASLPRPRLGFYGVIDERIDLPLLEQV